MRRFSTSVVAACVVVGLVPFSPEVEIELSLVRWDGLLGGLEHRITPSLLRSDSKGRHESSKLLLLNLFLLLLLLLGGLVSGILLAAVTLPGEMMTKNKKTPKFCNNFQATAKRLVLLYAFTTRF